MKVLVINGVNLNLLGIREPEIYGKSSYKELVSFIKNEARKLDIKVKVYQSNIEGNIVNKIQKSRKHFDYLIINPGAFTHSSIAIRDAITGVNFKMVEVHLSDITKREEFRKLDYFEDIALKRIMGKGFDSYKEALIYLKEETHG